MEIAKVTAKGQITIPIEIRKKMGIQEGDKILFIEENGTVQMVKSSMVAFKKAQVAFEGVAEEMGLKNEDDVVEMINKLRK